MMLLPKKVGPFTLMRRLGMDGVTESYVAILDEPAGKQVAARKVLGYVLGDSRRLADLEARVRDLRALKHPVLVPVLDYVTVGDDRYIVDDWVDAIDLQQVIQWCRDQQQPPPHNVYLNLATQICNGLEAIHSRPGADTGAEHILHLGLQPASIYLTPEGRILVGRYGLARSPTATPHTAAATASKMEYLSPEQTHPDQSLTPASDIFSLGTILYELLSLKSMFKAESNLQTIHRLRRAEVTTQLLEVKEILAGLDKVLYRALSLNPRHRYQRAFVLREDLRGLMAGFSFANIDEDTQDFLRPLFDARRDQGTDEVMPVLSGDDTQPETTASLLGHDGPAEDGQTTTTIEVLESHKASQATGLPVGVGDTTGPASQDTAAFLKAAQASMDGAKTRPENPISEPPEPVQAEPTPPPASPARPSTGFEEDDDVPTDVRPAPDETSWVAKLSPIDPKIDPHEPPSLPPHFANQAAAPQEAPPPAPSAPPAPATPAPPTPPPETKRPTLPATDFHAPQNLTAPIERPPAAAPSLEEPAEDLDDLDLDWRPKRSGVAPFVIGGVGLVAVAAAVLFLCSGAGAGFLWTASDRAPVSTAPATAPSAAATAPATADGDEADEAVAAADEADEGAREEVSRASSRDRDTRPAPRLPADRKPAEVRSASSVASEGTSRPRPRPTPRPDIPPPPAIDPVVAADYPVTEDVDPAGDEDLGELSDYAERSFRGELTDADRQVLQAVSTADPEYTRTYTLLYQDARARGDLDDRRAFLSAIMSQPENEYRPEFLVEEAELAIRGGNFSSALEKASLAERHWQRLPSDLIFSRKAMMFEIAASAHTGLFYDSDGQKLDALYNAIRGWEKYKRHVETKSRDDLMARADRQLDKLYDMQRRLE